MQESLNNFEIRHFINKNIKNYLNPFDPGRAPPPPPEDLSLRVFFIYSFIKSH